jgi:hypothetical protein
MPRTERNDDRIVAAVVAVDDATVRADAAPAPAPAPARAMEERQAPHRQHRTEKPEWDGSI